LPVPAGAFLGEAFRGDAPLHGGDINGVQENILDGHVVLPLDDFDRVLDILGGQGIAALQKLVEFLQDSAGQLDLGLGSFYGYLVAPVGELHPQQPADEAEILPLLAKQKLGQGIIRQGELIGDHGMGRVGGFHGD